MTDNSMPDLKVQVSRTDEQELAAPTLAESNLNNGPAEPCKRNVQVAVLKLSRADILIPANV